MRFRKQTGEKKAGLWLGAGLVIICGAVLLFFVWSLNKNQVTEELQFFMQQTCGNLNGKLEYLNDIVYALRDHETFLEGLKASGEFLDTEEAEDSFASAVDIGRLGNNANGSLPIVEAVWVFADPSHYVHTFYYTMSDTEIRQKDRNAEEALARFASSGKQDFYYDTDEAGSIYLLKLLYDEDMREAGTVVFEMKEKMLELLMAGTSAYPDSFWAVYDGDGRLLADSGTDLSGETMALKNAFRYDVYDGEIRGEACAVYTKELPMNLWVTAAIPGTRVTGMLFRTAGLYLLLIAAVTAALAVFVRYLLTQVYQKQYMLRKLELQYVQTQMNPHFMYNVLGTVAIEARLEGNEEVFRKLHSFTELLRSKILRDRSDKVKISQELEYVRYYLYLQNSRFGERIQYEIRVEDEKLQDCLVPKLCLQLIVENAVVHGLEPKLGPGKVTVRIYEPEKDVIYLDTIDDGVGFDQDGAVSLPLDFHDSDPSHNHVGLNNVYQLLLLIYGPKYGLSIFSGRGKGTTVRMTVPREKGRQEV